MKEGYVKKGLFSSYFIIKTREQIKRLMMVFEDELLD